ncbi:hypothetical protein CR513_25713, partial [Mucuna pruriens]
MIGDWLVNQQAWVYATEDNLTNWTTEVLLNQHFQKIINKEPSTQIDNVSLVCEDANQSDKSIEGEDTEVEASRDLEGINLGTETEKKEVWVAKQPELRQSLIELLKEYVDIFAWSY